MLFNAIRAGSLRDAVIVMAISLPAILLCLTVHEMCHGLAAYLLGDHTADNAGRLTLDPFAHIDPLGFLSMLLFGIGWARPVPVNTARFRIKNRKLGMAITALAGPLSNFILAFLMYVLYLLLSVKCDPTNTLISACIMFCWYTGSLSVGLGAFNLIPVYPLDGSHVLDLFLPFKYQVKIQQYHQYLVIAMVALVWLGGLDGLINVLRNGVLSLAIRLAQLFL